MSKHTLRVIVTGGRDFADADLLHLVLNKLQPDHLAVGDCPTGADLFARQWADKAYPGATHKVYVADWAFHGRKAGPLRNREMVQQNPGAILVAFPGGRGTASCIAEAQAEGMPVLEVRP